MHTEEDEEEEEVITLYIVQGSSENLQAEVNKTRRDSNHFFMVLDPEAMHVNTQILPSFLVLAFTIYVCSVLKQSRQEAMIS